MPAVKKTEDGRHARKVRTRGAILDALVALLDEGHPSPTAQEIADRAGVAIRSIAQHFATREQLLLAVAERHVARLPAPLAASDDSFESRLKAFVARRSEVLEQSVSMRKAARLGEAESKAVHEALQQTARARRKEVLAVFEKELSKQPGWLVTVLETVSSGTTWDEWRQTQSKTAAATLMANAIKRLLG